VTGAAAARGSGRQLTPVVALSLLWLGMVALVCVLGDLLTAAPHTQQDLLNRLKPPSFLGGPEPYLLGTDRLGRDMVARLVAATRISVVIALVGTALGALIGTALGFLAASQRGIVDETIMAAVDLQASLPFIIVALTVVAFFGTSLVLFVVLMGVAGWETYARVVRGVILQAEGQGYAQAVKALGASPWRLYGRHILPNIAHVLIVQFTLNFPQTILLETALSFLGLGIQPPLTSLGQLIGQGRDFLLNAWWIAVLPGIVIFLTTLALSLTGDWLRDRLDPTLQR
jgi:peptide/nickel transport system permease protein